MECSSFFTHMLHRIHTLLVTAYLIAGLALIASTPFADLRGQLLNSGGSTLIELVHDQGQNRPTDIMHGAANDATELSDEALAQMRSAVAAKQLMFGILLFTLGGFIHAYERFRHERPVHITVKKRKPMLLYWYQMKL